VPDKYLLASVDEAYLHPYSLECRKASSIGELQCCFFAEATSELSFRNKKATLRALKKSRVWSGTLPDHSLPLFQRPQHKNLTKDGTSFLS
jgi:hypothetical protein